MFCLVQINDFNRVINILSLVINQQAACAFIHFCYHYCYYIHFQYCILHFQVELGSAEMKAKSVEQCLSKIEKKIIFYKRSLYAQAGLKAAAVSGGCMALCHWNYICREIVVPVTLFGSAFYLSRAIHPLNWFQELRYDFEQQERQSKELTEKVYEFKQKFKQMEINRLAAIDRHELRNGIVWRQNGHHAICLCIQDA